MKTKRITEKFFNRKSQFICYTEQLTEPMLKPTYIIVATGRVSTAAAATSRWHRSTLLKEQAQCSLPKQMTIISKVY